MKQWYVLYVFLYFYIWVISKFIAYYGATFIRGLTVCYGRFYPYRSGLIHWHRGHLTTVRVPVRWRSLGNKWHAYVSCIMATTKPGHDDGIKWKRFPRYWSPVNYPHKGQWRGALMNKQLNIQSWDWWFETLSRSLWRHCNAQQTHAYIFTIPTAHNKSALSATVVTFGDFTNRNQLNKQRWD